MPSATFWKRCAPLTIGSPACARASRHNHPAMTTAKSRATPPRMGDLPERGPVYPREASRFFCRRGCHLWRPLPGRPEGRPLLQGPDDAHADTLGGLAAEIEKDPAHVELHAN